MGAAERRLKLSQQLHQVFDQRDHIYFQPPEGTILSYPAIVYQRKKMDHENADNIKYLIYDRYQVTYIHKDADDTVVDKLLNLPGFIHDDQFSSADMYHDVFTVYVR